MTKSIDRFKKVLSLVFVFLIVVQSVSVTQTEATSAKKENMQAKVDKIKSRTIAVGKIQQNKENFQYEDINIPSYNCMNVSYIALSDLRKAGGNVVWDSKTGKTTIYDLKQAKSPNPKFESFKQDAMAYLGRDAIYIHHQEIPAIYVDGKALIPEKWIPSLLTSKSSNTPKEIQKEAEKEADIEDISNIGNIEDIDLDADLDVDEQMEDFQEDMEVDVDADFEEETEEEIEEEEKVVVGEKGIKGINIWFDGKDYIEEPYDFSNLQPGQFGFYQDKRYNDNTEYLYVGYVISRVDGVPNQNGDSHKAWLKNPTYYTIPKVATPQNITNLFPDTRVKGTMKYAAGGFKKGETVSVKRAHSNTSYYLWDKNGKEVKVPWASVAIQKAPVSKVLATTEQIEAYINGKDFSSKTDYFVWTDVYRQRTYVFKGSKNNWKLIKNFQCSTGKDTHLTPVGRYTLNVKVPSFGTNRYRAKNAYAFIGTSYLYHSVLYDPTGSYLLSGWGSLGNKASSGCIRLSPESSVWFYKTLPIGTGIFIN